MVSRMCFVLAGAVLITGMAGAPAARAATRPASPRWMVVDSRHHAVTLTIIAGYTDAVGGFNFNGYGNGKLVVSVPNGYKVTVIFSNKSATPHSVVFVPFAQKNKEDGYTPAFRGASSPDNQNGITAGHAPQRFSFVASKAGTYAIVCGVPGHEGAGMWDVFTVSRGGKPSYTVKR